MTDFGNEAIFENAVKKNLRNHGVLSNTRSTVNNARKAMTSGDKEVASESVRLATRVLDRAVQKGILHKNNASRRKSRLVLQLNKM